MPGECVIIIFLCFSNLLEFSTLIKYASFNINKLKDITQDLTKDVTQDIKILIKYSKIKNIYNIIWPFIM